MLIETQNDLRSPATIPGTEFSWDYARKLPDRLQGVFFDGQKPRTVQQVIAHLRGISPYFDASDPNRRVTAELLGYSPAVKFSRFGPRQMIAGTVLNRFPLPGQGTLAVLGNSVCQTDLSIDHEFKEGRRDDVADIVTFHEGWGEFMSLGKDVSPKLYKKIVIMDSHASGNHFKVKDGDLEYHTDSYAQCAPHGCDTIVAGVTPRIARGIDGKTIFRYHLSGYGTRVATVEASAIGHVVEDERILDYFSDLSRCESLGNLWRIINGLKERGYKGEGNKNVMVITGLGATGMPLAIIARHYGFPVIGIENTAWRRETARNLGVCDAVFENAAQAMQYLGSNEKYADTSSLIVPVMVGSQDVYADAYALVQNRVEQFPKKDKNSLPHIIVAFGLLSNPDTRLELPGIPQDIGERAI